MFNRLATHFNISMFGHQTVFDGVGSPNNLQNGHGTIRSTMSRVVFIMLLSALPLDLLLSCIGFKTLGLRHGSRRSTTAMATSSRQEGNLLNTYTVATGVSYGFALDADASIAFPFGKILSCLIKSK